jgi:quinol monooxygenase YgiN
MGMWMNKKTMLLGGLLTCLTVMPAVGQILDIQYLDVPRQHMQEFAELHKEMMELSAQGPTTITGHFVYAHAYAGPHSLVVVNRYANTVDMERDSSNAGIRNYAESISDSTEQAAFRNKVNKYFSWYLEGHSDEVRSIVADYGFFKEDLDPAKMHVVVVGHYNPKWSDMQEFMELYDDQLIAAGRESGYPDGISLNTHLRGSGAGVSAVNWFPSWEVFAKSVSEAPENDSEQMDRLWEIAGQHHDDIYVSVGSMVDGKFVMKDWQ